MESVVALFPDPAQARQALDALQARGFERERLGFALTDVVAENDIAQATGISPEAGAPGGSGTAAAARRRSRSTPRGWRGPINKPPNC